MYIAELYKCKTVHSKTSLLEILKVPSIIHAEVEKAIDIKKVEKAMGSDVIGNDILKHSKDTLAVIFTDNLCSTIL